MAKRLWLGMFAMVLAFGMTVTGCGNDEVSPIDGRWAYSGDPSFVTVFGDGVFRSYVDGVLESTGTFTISGNNLTSTMTVDGVTFSSTGTFALSNNGNTLTFTVTEGGETFSLVYHRLR